ncbi:MAG TPA: hypothetical protein PLZ32_07470 [Saprospiraceae bacterium]|nr:hypothetical protein [Saprospiraceae bacterium]
MILFTNLLKEVAEIVLQTGNDRGDLVKGITNKGNVKPAMVSALYTIKLCL